MAFRCILGAGITGAGAIATAGVRTVGQIVASGSHALIVTVVRLCAGFGAAIDRAIILGFEWTVRRVSGALARSLCRSLEPESIHPRRSSNGTSRGVKEMLCLIQKETCAGSDRL